MLNITQLTCFQAVAIALSLFQLALLVSWLSVTVGSSRLITGAIVPAVLKFLVLSIVPILSYLEDRRSIQPSTILNAYLLLSLVVELLQTGTIYLQGIRYMRPNLTFINMGLHVVLLILESQNKRGYLKPAYQHLPPEATSGIISRTSFWWVNELFRKGSRGLITFDDLYDLDPVLGGDNVGERMAKAWNKRSMLVPLTQQNYIDAHKPNQMADSH
jgi:ATP-binding cassette subfamily C (CFTR/MRP) protein 1